MSCRSPVRVSQVDRSGSSTGYHLSGRANFLSYEFFIACTRDARYATALLRIHKAAYSIFNGFHARDKSTIDKSDYNAPRHSGRGECLVAAASKQLFAMIIRRGNFERRDATACRIRVAVRRECTMNARGWKQAACMNFGDCPRAIRKSEKMARARMERERRTDLRSSSFDHDLLRRSSPFIHLVVRNHEMSIQNALRDLSTAARTLLVTFRDDISARNIN